MPDPITLTAGIGWGVSGAGWLLSPILSRFVNKCFEALGEDSIFKSRKKTFTKNLDDLQTRLLPQLIILTDSAQRSPYRGELKAWLQKLKSAYYEAEHLLGLVQYTQLEEKANSSFPTKSTFNFSFNVWDLKLRKYNLLKSLENLEKIIIDETRRLAPIINLSTNSFNNSIPRPDEQPKQKSSGTISTSAIKVVGRDKDRDNIVKLLLEVPNSTNCYSVIGLWGMGGSGKTTLAQYVKKCVEDNHLNIKNLKEDGFFDLVAWVHVSQNFNVESILTGIWESAFPDQCPKFQTIEGLHSKLKEKLKGQRFLLVLDDAWCDKGVTEDEFDQLFALLQDAKRGSKILVTTRIKGAAEALGATKLIALRQLDHDEFVDLFMSHALRDLTNAQPHSEGILKQIGEQIAAKLHRSPLAATTVAAQLRRTENQNPDCWKAMLTKNLLNETMGALLLSYQNLPPPLQRCFAFCSLFPKGHKFSQDRLVGLWIGEDFIERDDSNRHVRDIGNEYMLELISRSFLQVRNDRQRTSYSIHDLLHDLAEKVSNGEYFRVEGGETREIPQQTRHLYVEACMFKEYLNKICKSKDLRTLIVGSSWGVTLKKNDLDALFKGSKKFYVIDFCFNSIVGLPKSVFYLKNLRYLNYRRTIEMNFPKLCTRLYQLRLLGEPCINDSPHIKIPNIGRLTLLQDLRNFSVRNESGCGTEQLEHLRDLYGKLVIHGLINVKGPEEARRLKLSNKKNLLTLELHNWQWQSFVDPMNPTRLKSDEAIVGELCPQSQIKDVEVIWDEICPPSQIEKLTISFYGGKRCPKWFSAYNKNTTHLMELELIQCPFIEALPEISNLIHLQSLYIDGLSGLKWWASLPSNLVHLKISNCHSLTFASKDDLMMIMSTIRSREQSLINKELMKIVSGSLYNEYLNMQKKLDSICQLEEVNEKLYLPPKLEKLEMILCFITDKILASSMQHHTSLIHLDLWYIITITCIPKEVLRTLPKIQVIRINYCPMLTSIGGLETLSSLEDLMITVCPYLAIEMPILATSNILKWVTISNFKPANGLLQALNSVETLKIDNCESIQTLNFSNSKSLSYLSLRNCVNLVSLMGLNELNNLKYLTVVGCDKLQCSSDGSKLSGLRELTISKSSMLQVISADALSSLSSLKVEGAGKEDITQEECEILSHCSSLETIEFEDCDEMQSLPNLSHLCSLTALKINRCNGLTLLSELPPSVQRICIDYCNAEFTRSCKDTSHPNGQKIPRTSQILSPRLTEFLL